MKRFALEPLTMKEKHYAQLPDSVTSFCRDNLQNSKLCILFDLQLTMPEPKQQLFNFYSPLPQRTTLRKFFLEKINDPQTPYSYIAMIYNSLVLNRNPIVFFNKFDAETQYLCKVAFERYTDLLNNSLPETLEFELRM